MWSREPKRTRGGRERNSSFPTPPGRIARFHLRALGLSQGHPDKERRQRREPHPDPILLDRAALVKYRVARGISPRGEAPAVSPPRRRPARSGRPPASSRRPTGSPSAGAPGANRAPHRRRSAHPVKRGTFVQNVHGFLIRSSTSGFCPDATNRVTQELVTPKYRATSAPE